MKKLTLWIGLILTISTMQTTLSYADDLDDNNEVEFETVTRAGYGNLFFKSYPPKTYKGWTLVAVKKVSNGYMGMYMW